MQSILHIIKLFKDGLMAGDSRFDYDREHVEDTLTGVKLHLYDDGFKVTHNDEIMYTSKEADTKEFLDENKMLDYIHQMLKQHFDKTDKQKAIENRSKLIHLYTHPEKSLEHNRSVAEIGQGQVNEGSEY